MENRRGQSGIYAGQGLKQGHKVLSAAGAAGGDDRYGNRVGDGLQHRQIEAALDAGSSQVWLDVYQADTKYSGAYLLADIYEDCWLWPTYDLAAYYGIDQVYGLPALQADAG